MVLRFEHSGNECWGYKTKFEKMLVYETKDVKFHMTTNLKIHTVQKSFILQSVVYQTQVQTQTSADTFNFPECKFNNSNIKYSLFTNLTRNAKFKNSIRSDYSTHYWPKLIGHYEISSQKIKKECIFSKSFKTSAFDEEI